MQGLQEKFLLFRVLRFRDKQAYGELYMAYAPRLRRYLVFKLPTEHDADEILAEVFLKAWDYLTSTPVESLGGLLFSIGRHRVADYYRAKGRKEEFSSEAFQEELTFADEGKGARIIKDQAEAELLREVIQVLPHDQQAVILLRYFDGLSVSDVAEHLQKTDNHVRVLTHRGLKAIREKIGK
ncbi:MAG: RNA polymerase ECF-type sigma factor [Candidatus Giovannonibacteria bacterium GW2011_GWA2_53_7]|uniref:RNA polymerase ECF-type sigma factor n=1 Tax=Candidatus Giovannonibacteria bacterium GW2011_GWA2_53_7 TaxID=1618650 RepID=A0A0G2A1L8_9BACT|nr:MAG: RNA polymerase ECF-type sigma factor [Candidatus Giovannonibacteria bacterium GW2011_GWA2_53_7]